MTNYKTTVAGFVVAVINLIANGVNWKQALFSAAIAALGTVAKDFNVTGVGSSAKAGKDAEMMTAKIAEELPKK